ncbi:MAG: hypothetical protein D3924_06065 [Candidatus Electrothrix sp. AR4]|nr:hypothetical protein [Candidatus Electrothrix sp. AR4]
MSAAQRLRPTNQFTGYRERLRPCGVKLIGGTSNFKRSAAGLIDKNNLISNTFKTAIKEVINMR